MLLPELLISKVENKDEEGKEEEEIGDGDSNKNNNTFFGCETWSHNRRD